MRDRLISIVTPVFNEADNLAEFHARLKQCLDVIGLSWEWLAVDDGSTDASPAVLAEMASAETRLRVLTQECNRGSHAAIFHGLREARGDKAVVLSADLQDPPEIIPKLLDAAQTGASVVWAARTKAAGATTLDRLCSAAFHCAVRWWTGLPAPQYGADCFLAGRAVLDEIAQWNDFGPNLFLRLLSLPVPQQSIPHDRQPRVHGRSGWTLMQKLRLAIFSLLAHTSPRSWVQRARSALWRAGQSLAAPGAARAIRKLVREWLAAHPACKTHLDVGCGIRSWLSDAGVQPVGVDSNASRVAIFHRGGGRAVVASSTALPFASGAFDAVWSFGLLHHLSDDELEKSLAEMRRVTAPGGWIVVFDAVWPRSCWRHPLAAMVRAMDAGRHVRSEEQLRASLESLGEWQCRRVTYAWNGLEGIFCTHHRAAGGQHAKAAEVLRDVLAVEPPRG